MLRPSRRLLRLFPLALLLALSSCAGRLLSRAREAERVGAHYEAERLYKELYKSTPTKERQRRALYSLHAAEAAYRGRRYATARALLQRAQRLHLPDSLLRKSKLYTTLSTAALQAEDSSPQGLYEVERFDRLRSTRSEFGVSFTPDGRTLLFGSHRPTALSKSISPVTGEPLGHLYRLGQQADGTWLSAPDSLQGLAEATAELGTPSLSPDGRRLYYTYAPQHQGEHNTPQIWVATPDERGRWQPSGPLRLFADSTRLTAHPAVSPSGGRLFFVSEAPDKARQDKELYYVDLYGDALGAPVPITGVSSTADELFPYATSDSTLYFASDRSGGFGGLDIYEATLHSDGHTTLLHLPSPINSEADELTFTPTPAPQAWPSAEPLAEAGLFASSRDDTRGLPHLYEFRRRQMTTTITGYVLDREEEPIRGATVRIVGRRPDGTEQLITTDSEGAFRLTVAPDTEYILLASSRDYLNQFVRLRTDPQQALSEEYTVEFFLSSHVRPEALREVYYAFDRADLLPESTPALETLYQMLTDNPEVKIRLTAHTDRRGTVSYNARLSQQRAESVVRYLIGRGIAPERLEAMGRGSDEPYTVTKRTAAAYPFLAVGTVLTPDFIASLTKPEEQAVCDQLNRRTAFEVRATP
ncbi:OmpA family protein [Porphyromonas pasteri]|uniref:OmpA family protein n=1 Tax=Porphyromonas pasteri TaxID=1583331 RepID=UPI00360D1726